MTHPGNRPVKIALVGDTLATGGAERIQAMVSQMLSGQGFEIVHILLQDKIGYAHAGRVIGLGKKLPKGKPQLFLWALRLRKALKKEAPDFIIDFRYRSGFSYEFLLSRFAYAAPTIYTVHSGAVENYIGKRPIGWRLVYDRAFAVVAISQKMREALESRLSRKVDLIYNPVELARIAELSQAFQPEESDYIVAVGRLNERVKQFDSLIEAYAESTLAQSATKLLIIGDGPLLPKLQEQVERLDLAGKVLLKGRQENPFPYMRNARCTVLCSAYEGFPNVLLESLATGTPVVSFDVFSGPSEIITHGQNGWLTKDQDFPELLRSIAAFLDNAALQDTCRANAKASVSQFAPEAIAPLWVELLSRPLR